MRPWIHGPGDITINSNTTISIMDFGIFDYAQLIINLIFVTISISVSLWCLCREVFAYLIYRQANANEIVLNEAIEMKETIRNSIVDREESINEALEDQEIANDERVNEIIDSEVQEIANDDRVNVIVHEANEIIRAPMDDSSNGHTTITTSTETLKA